MPLVSVIVPFLDEERFLPEAIESVVGQSHPDIEMLLVDDGSNDESTAIAKENAARMPDRVRYLDHPGHASRGASAARNLGIAEARGEYVAFLDGDDVWVADKLARQVELLDAHPRAGFLCAPARWWYSWNGAAQISDFVQDLGVPLDAVAEPPALLASYLEDEWASLCDLLVRRSLLDEVGVWEEQFPGMFDDQVFHAKLCLHSPAYVSAEVGYLYRQHPEQTTARAHEGPVPHDRTRRAFLEWLQGYLKRSGRARSRLGIHVARELFPMRHPRLGRAVGSAKGAEQALRRRVGGAARNAPWIWAGASRLGLTREAPPPGAARAGALRRLEPVSHHMGYDRGTPVDRAYIDPFIERHARDIRGRVLEIGDATYTRRFGGGRVERSDVLNPPSMEEPGTTVVADLTAGALEVPSASFDCVILTQVLPVVFDVAPMLDAVHRILSPGGVALVTAPGTISAIDGDDDEHFGWFWGFTRASLRALLDASFPDCRIAVEAHGNVLVATAFIQGLAAEELTAEELDLYDERFQIVVTGRVEKAEPGE